MQRPGRRTLSVEPPFTTTWYTDRGRRPANEDAVVVETLFGDRDLVAVADGMGGHAGGEVASHRALERLVASLEASNDLAAAVRDANDELLRAAEAHPEWQGMGTTLVALLRVGAEYYVANVGDSRAYRIDGDGLRQITVDHSFTAEAITSGRLSAEEAERSPWRNALTRAVGTDSEVDVDLFGPFPVTPAHLVVLCTDGLYRVMSDEELAQEVFAALDRPDGARDLVANALRRGSSDNISVALVEIGDVSTLQAAAPSDRPSTSPAATSPPLPAEPEPVAQAETVPDTAVPVAELAPDQVVAEELGSDSERPTSSEEDAGTQETQEVGRLESAAGEAPEDERESAEPAGQRPVGIESDSEASGAALPVEDDVLVEVGSDHSTRSVGHVDPVGADEGESEAPGPVDATRSDESEPPEASGPAAVDQDAVSASGESASAPSEPYRTARPARVRRTARRGRRPPRKIPSWVKREGLPAALLVALTLFVVYMLTNFLG